ncbi:MULTISPECIES: hypothetical protein [unclassified Carboxylicivirga]|uniref:hypothetical protein n=1 Tax=Carboxylicivirga TaxID=1628153 RepID=UPI003D35340D
MQTGWIKEMKETKRLKLSFWQLATHYSVAAFVLIPTIFTLANLFEIHVTKTYNGVRSGEELIETTIPFVVVAVLFVIIQYRRLRLKKFQFEYTEDEFKQAVEITAKKLEWTTVKNNHSFLRAHRAWNWTGSWGEMITIIKVKDGLLVNSICDPSCRPSIASFGWNRKNINTFLKILSETKQGINHEERVEIQEREWSLKRVATRFVMYPLCIGFIILGLYMFTNPTNWKSQGAALGAISISIFYLYIDLKLIRKKKVRKPNKPQ